MIYQVEIKYSIEINIGKLSQRYDITDSPILHDGILINELISHFNFSSLEKL